MKKKCDMAQAGFLLGSYRSLVAVFKGFSRLYIVRTSCEQWVASGLCSFSPPSYSLKLCYRGTTEERAQHIVGA